MSCDHDDTKLEGFETTHGRSTLFYDSFERKPELKHQTHYCPGCGHGVVHKLVAETLGEMGLQDSTIFVSPVGCSVFGFYYFDVGNVQAAHGRAPAVGTALKRTRPESVVVVYQGDGDLAAIGTAEIIHAANRGEKITVFFVNNAIYGMTGGQMAPTTLVGQKSTTTPWGRRPLNEGYPMRICELLSSLEAPAYIARVSLHDAKNVMKARKSVKKALELQRDGAGFSLVEILSPCPTVWKMDPAAARKFIEERMVPVFPLKVFRDRKPEPVDDTAPPVRSVAEVLGIDAAGAKGAAAQEPPQGEGLTLKVAGFGGQGILLLGQILSEIGMREGYEVSWLPSYGPEMRSGSAHCHVCILPERVGSPLISKPGALIAMNEISLRKFGPSVQKGGLVLYDRDRLPEGVDLDHVRTICVPASEIADGLGSTKVANIVMLGALLEESGLLPLERAEEVLEAMIKRTDLLELDRRALAAGAGFIRDKVRTAV
ncbi:MAG TPA: 2-oxoacid:acceptor oxidoreductase family protein [Candidatus Saccharimonadales bacterium]|nr:2-oxoacid:acceptor oxidoreductase family protein [Candidatus Saccharimonadales bacterium]